MAGAEVVALLQLLIFVKICEAMEWLLSVLRNVMIKIYLMAMDEVHIAKLNVDMDESTIINLQLVVCDMNSEEME